MRDYLSLMRMDCKAHKHTRTRLSPSSSIPECPQPAVLRTSPTAPCPGAPWRGGAALELDDTTHYDVGRYVTQARRQRALWGRPVRPGSHASQGRTGRYRRGIRESWLAHPATPRPDT